MPRQSKLKSNTCISKKGERGREGRKVGKRKERKGKRVKERKVRACALKTLKVEGRTQTS